MGPADEIDHQYRIQGGEPRRYRGIGAPAPGYSRNQQADQANPDQCQRAHRHGGGVGMETGQIDDQVLQLQAQRPVGRRRLPPHPGDLIGERPRQHRRPRIVGVDAVVDQPSLGCIAIGVMAEDGWGEQEGSTPNSQDRPMAQMTVGMASGFGRVRPWA